MNAEATATNINEAIDWLQQTGTQVQNFAIEQAPLYCREVVAWEFWSSIYWIVFSCIPLIAGSISLFWGARRFEEDPWCNKSGPTLLGGGMAVLAAITMICSVAPQAVKACVAPRLVIVEHLRGLTK